MRIQIEALKLVSAGVWVTGKYTEIPEGAAQYLEARVLIQGPGAALLMLGMYIDIETVIVREPMEFLSATSPLERLARTPRCGNGVLHHAAAMTIREQLVKLTLTIDPGRCADCDAWVGLQTGGTKAPLIAASTETADE